MNGALRLMGWAALAALLPWGGVWADDNKGLATVRGVVVEVEPGAVASALNVRWEGSGGIRHDREAAVYSRNFNHSGYALAVEGEPVSWPGTDVAKLVALVKSWAGGQKATEAKVPTQTGDTQAASELGPTGELEAYRAWRSAADRVLAEQEKLTAAVAAYNSRLAEYVKKSATAGRIAEQSEAALTAAAKPLSLRAAQDAMRLHLTVLLDDGTVLDLAANGVRDAHQLAAAIRTSWEALSNQFGAVQQAQQGYAGALEDEGKLRGAAVDTLTDARSKTKHTGQIEALDTELGRAEDLDRFDREWTSAWAGLQANHARLAKEAPNTDVGKEALDRLVTLAEQIGLLLLADPGSYYHVGTIPAARTKGDDVNVTATARSRTDSAVSYSGSAKPPVRGGIRVRLSSAYVGTFGVADDDVTIQQIPAAVGNPATGRLIVDRENFSFGDAQLIVFEPRHGGDVTLGGAFGANLLDGAARRIFLGPTVTFGRGDVRVTVPFGLVFGRVRGLANTVDPAANYASVSESSLGKRDNVWKLGGFAGLGLGIEF